MKLSQYLLPTLKEVPSDAELVSHRLMLRAGMIRKLASGLYVWLPIGLRVLKKIEAIVCEEMDKAGAQQTLMPLVQPAELWKETGRWYDFGNELLRIQDRHTRDFVIGPTHEEVITSIIRDSINSYKQLPINIYQVQHKFRDERRPRFGVMRCREFLMKDAYSFHENDSCLKDYYTKMRVTYSNIFDRIGLKYSIVEADSGSIGGNASEEFHVLAASGEDELAICETSNYAANIEKAEALAKLNDNEEQPLTELKTIHTPNIKNITQLVTELGIDIKDTVKTLIVEAAEHSKDKLIALIIRGDHSLNELKAAKLDILPSKIKFATNEKIIDKLGTSIGSLGPVHCPIPIIVDKSVAKMRNFYAGANSEGYHFGGINWDRDCHYLEVADLRNIIEGDDSPCGKGKITIKRGIEVGHIFQLGTKYSEAMGANIINKAGKNSPLYMGCYGIGISRIVSAVIEQQHDDQGIIWPKSVAPFQVLIIALKYKSSIVRQQADALYKKLCEHNIEILFDDRNISPGVKFAEAELLGIPHCIIMSERNLENQQVEYKDRQDTANNCMLSIDNIIDFILKKI